MRRVRDALRWFPQALGLVAMIVALASVQTSQAANVPAIPAAFKKAAPTTVQDLKDIQTHVQAVVQQVMPAVVNVKVGAGQGSGVIISEDGYILTAGHVSGAAGQKVLVTLADGRNVKGITLGANVIVDSGLIKITDEGKWPFVEIGDSANLQKGDWCICLGHPNGWQKGRDPVLRLGRVLDNLKTVIRTDCTLVGGDSGGPLFDMNGKVIGIHSRIMVFTYQNYHVPAKEYKEDWTRLVKGDVIYPAYLGVKRDPDEVVCKVKEVIANSAAAKSGIQVDDVITRVADKKINTFEDLANAMNAYRSGDEVTIEIQRGEATISLNVVLGAFKK
jgi:serine protease Do